MLEPPDRTGDEQPEVDVAARQSPLDDRSDVVVFCGEPVEPDRLSFGLQGRSCLLGEPGQVAGETRGRCVQSAGRFEFGHGELTDRPQHREPGDTVIERSAEEALVVEGLDQVDGVGCEIRVQDGFDGLECEPADRHRQLGERLAFGIFEQTVAPFDRPDECPMPVRRLSPAAPEHPESIADPIVQPREPEHPEAGSGELKRQRQPVQFGDDSRDHPDVGRRDREARVGLGGAVHEQRNRIRFQEMLDVVGGPIWQAHRLDLVHLLAGDPNHLLTGDHDRQPRRFGPEAGDHRSGVYDLFEVVEHEQRRAIRESGHECVDGFDAGLGLQADLLGDRPGNQHRLGQRFECDEVDAIGEAVQRTPCDIERQPGLADAARSCERQKRRGLEQFEEVIDLARPADETRRLGREVVRRCADRPDRWEVGRETACEHLVDLDRRFEILESMRAEPANRQPGPFWQRSPSGLGDQDLTTVSCCRDAGGAVHVHAYVVGATERAVTGVEAHAHLESNAFGPIVAGQCALACDRRFDGVAGGGKRHEERIALHPDFDPGGKGRPQQLVVIFQDSAEFVTEPLHQLGGALDVGEQEGHGSCREVMHLQFLSSARYS